MEHFYLSKTGLTTFWNKCKSMFVKSSEKGRANGVSTLDRNGFVPLSQLGNIDLSDYVQTTTLTTELAKKVDKVTGKDLSSNDYTNEDKTKLTSIIEVSNDFINSLE